MVQIHTATRILKFVLWVHLVDITSASAVLRIDIADTGFSHLFRTCRLHAHRHRRPLIFPLWCTCHLTVARRHRQYSHWLRAPHSAKISDANMIYVLSALGLPALLADKHNGRQRPRGRAPTWKKNMSTRR
ncbi:hypothetical protein DFH08DRAFT_832256 [Mycena albidolilacea]|uniref:Secreted protein n=1 Tax=Mycena albidolilacea TaxID=1033008 RepID=A0AAD7AVI7_9AGAR|nr:hypothetical protein DFH08DRAFT_832256 [Mycena albidolilacea]